MPLESMTGFSCSKIFIDGNEISCEIRSVNSKFLDVKFKALNQSNNFEAFALNQTKKMFSRGSIEIKLNNFARIAQKISINQTLLQLTSFNIFWVEIIFPFALFNIVIINFCAVE